MEGSERDEIGDVHGAMVCQNTGGLSEGRKKNFYTTSREGNISFIVQMCSNTRGCYMTLVEYGGGGRRSFIYFYIRRVGG